MSPSASKDSRRTGLIERFVLNWQILRPHIENLPTHFDQAEIFICPLCHRVFTKDKWQDLTLEHVPPERVGGKAIVVTCAACNSISGFTLDTHLVREQDFLDFGDGLPGSSLVGEYSVNDVPHKLWARFSFGPHGEWIVEGDPHPKRTNPEYLQEAMDSLEETSWKDFRMKFYFKGHNRRRMCLSLLRAAYLWGFATFGYIFLFNPHMERIRQQFADPTQDLIDCGVLEGDFSSAGIGVNIIREPTELRSYLVVFELPSKLGTLRRKAMVLPAPFEDSLDVYKQLKDRSHSTVSLKLTYVNGDFDMNQDPRILIKLWEELG